MPLSAAGEHLPGETRTCGQSRRRFALRNVAQLAVALSVVAFFSAAAVHEGRGIDDPSAGLEEIGPDLIPAGPYDLIPIVSPGDSVPGAAGLVVSAALETAVNAAGQVAVDVWFRDPLTPEADLTNTLYLIDEDQFRPIITLDQRVDELKLNEGGSAGFLSAGVLRVANPDEAVVEVKAGDNVAALSAPLASDPEPVAYRGQTQSRSPPFPQRSNSCKARMVALTVSFPTSTCTHCRG